MAELEEENAEAFFASAPPLRNREAIVSSVDEFVRRRLLPDTSGFTFSVDLS